MRHRLKALAVAAMSLTAAAVVFGAGSAGADTGADTTPPSVPSQVVYTADLDTGVISWDRSTDAVTPRMELRYRIYYEGELVSQRYGAYPSLDFTYAYYAAADPVVFNGEYTITAVDASGNESAPSRPVEVDNLVDLDTDTTPPSAPADLTYTVGSLETFTGGSLEWDASVDDLTAVHYKVYLDGEPIQLLDPLYYLYPTRVDFFKEILVCVNEDIRPGVYTVTAVDRAGNESASSDPVLITTFF